MYKHTTEPLTINFDETPVGMKRAGEGNVKHIKYYVEVVWDQNAIGHVAKENGFEEVYYADLETLSVLGIWSQFTVHVYGKEKRESR